MTVLATLTVALAAGCGIGSGSSSGTTTPSASKTVSDEDQARQVVQNYLEAMQAKDTAKGKEQMCPALHEQFDKEATGKDGDFSPEIVLKEQSIARVQGKGEDGQRVTATMVVQAKAADANPVKADIAFDVHKLGDLWCIYNEEIVGKPTPASS